MTKSVTGQTRLLLRRSLQGLPILLERFYLIQPLGNRTVDL